MELPCSVHPWRSCRTRSGPTAALGRPKLSLRLGATHARLDTLRETDPFLLGYRREDPLHRFVEHADSTGGIPPVAESLDTMRRKPLEVLESFAYTFPARTVQ